ncbi:hypothetical protein BDU57DRAFT_158200 [Ampelomyces quisqualis]|uniref:F-box domain-containing protein n=1 Tax=Ampelomyces quisqualis TaxID=50730 RepID=A0A6A5QQY0_AMPQU|nr:hypothetical protein BDU57DRAFT_158200 [Ampelomyces quisqualis]
MTDVPKLTFLRLPTELRLQIAAYVFQQDESTGIIKISDRRRRLDRDYSAASHLSTLLVCRQFKHDFRDLAYRLTTFVFTIHNMHAIRQEPNTKLRNLRKLVIGGAWPQVDAWAMYLFDTGCLDLEQLCLVGSLPQDFGPVIGLLRRIQKVKSLRIFPTYGNHFIVYGGLVGALYKDDHFHRYDTNGAPEISDIWWEPHFNAKDSSFDFLPCNPEPEMAEQDYLLMMKPKIDEIIEWMEKGENLLNHA